MLLDVLIVLAVVWLVVEWIGYCEIHNKSWDQFRRKQDSAKYPVSRRSIFVALGALAALIMARLQGIEL